MFERLRPALIITRREIRDQFRDWRIIIPIIVLTLVFPAIMNFTARHQSFSQTDLQRFGLSADDAAQVDAYQQAGYQVQVVSPEEARQMTGGQFSNSQWLVIGLIVIVVAVAVAAD